MDMKGLDMSLSFVIAIAIGLLVVGIIIALLTGNLGGLESFALNNTEFGIGG